MPRCSTELLRRIGVPYGYFFHTLCRIDDDADGAALEACAAIVCDDAPPTRSRAAWWAWARLAMSRSIDLGLREAHGRWAGGGAAIEVRIRRMLRRFAAAHRHFALDSGIAAPWTPIVERVRDGEWHAARCVLDDEDRSAPGTTNVAAS